MAAETMKRIGEVVASQGISADTLRYYEKIELMPRVKRSAGGARLYSDTDISRLSFIRHAKKMGFSLDEITLLLRFRENPRKARPRVRKLAREKLAEIENSLAALSALRDELRHLSDLCAAGSSACPILTKIDQG